MGVLTRRSWARGEVTASTRAAFVICGTDCGLLGLKVKLGNNQMAIRIACGGCGRQMKAQDQYAGKTVRCPKCNTAIGIPKLAPGNVQNSGDANDRAKTVAAAGCFGCFGTVILFSLAASFFININADESSKVANTEGTAWVYCKDFVKERLTSPASAEFPSRLSGNVLVTSSAGRRLSFQSYVESNNALGVKLRTDFTCKVRYHENSDSWLLVSLDM